MQDQLLYNRLLLGSATNIVTHCWEWKKAKTAHGYGAISVAGNQCAVHRVSFELFNGKIPEGIFVLHSCDNPSCWNPTHLFLGTQQDNMNDMKRKGRQYPKITPELIQAVKAFDGNIWKAAVKFQLPSRKISEILKLQPPVPL